ncbi:ABC transporter ATP-binding protein [Pyrobaculum aerophilum]|uniref:ABC transporter ATP-binding protein n=1 Tax=Pyrobaculum aerophilum TaxID=13773 RepID=A0A371QZE6_9CREN|nr:ABC transporter ATP-binding protein [Pyrobaculum aerophilum]RFA96157.1 ABC transporter ATP-binding protein [Pyrobaculum aerophilum]RFA96299.1 ABC transporter ATP-binding protein [Pyrobaculum aerophilum]
MLSVKQLNAGYGKFQILFDVNIEAPPNAITTLLGPNGSGKSTLLKTIFGLTSVYSGEVWYNGTNITKLPPHERAKLGLAYLPQVGSTFNELTVEENLKMAAYTLPPEEYRERLEEVFSMFPILREFRKRRAGSLSGGQRQMLAIAMALMRKAKFIMLDEPTAMLAPKVAYEIAETIVELKRRGITVLLAEQNALLALEIADKAYLLVSGRVVFEGKPKELLENPELGKMYLGLSS